MQINSSFNGVVVSCHGGILCSIRDELGLGMEKREESANRFITWSLMTVLAVLEKKHRYMFKIPFDLSLALATGNMPPSITSQVRRKPLSEYLISNE